MKPFAILAALLVALLPAAALARQCTKGNAPVCEAGFNWDEASQACVEIVTG